MALVLFLPHWSSTPQVGGPTMSENTSTLTLKFKEEFYRAVPHLYDSAPPSKKDFTEASSEITVVRCKIGQELPQGHFLCKNPDGSRWYFVQSVDKKAHLFDGFKEMLSAQRQQDPILCDQDGYVLDGFARWFALMKLGLDPNHQIVNAHLADDAAKISWIRSRKLGRANLSERQRMQIVVAEIMTHPQRSNSWTAELLGVSRNTIIKYRERLEREGLLSPVSNLIGKNGEEYHKPEKPISTEELEKKEQEKLKRQQQKKDEIIQEFKQSHIDMLLTPNQGDSLSKMVKFVNSTNMTNPTLKPGITELQEALGKQFEADWQPKHNERCVGAPDEEIRNELSSYVPEDAILGFKRYLELLAEEDTAEYLVEDREQQEIDAIIKNLQSLIREADILLGQLTPVSVTGTALWNVKTVDMTKTKAGLSIKIKPDNVPDKVDVLEGVKPGQVSVGGKMINFVAGKCLLLIPHQPVDAVAAPSEDDLLMMGISRPVSEDEVLNASDN
jgi:ParB-like chromosome segregation protein Spo0J